MNNVKIRPKTSRYSLEEYKEILNTVTNGNIRLVGEFKNITTSTSHYCKKHDITFDVKPSKFTRSDPQKGCYECGREIVGDLKRKTNEKFLTELKNVWGDEYTPLEKYITSDKPIWFMHNTKNPHKCLKSPNDLLQGHGCGACVGNFVSVGFNDIHTTRPDIAAIFYNESESYLYTEFSGKRVDFRCPNCGKRIPQLLIRDVSRRGLSCPFCSDGISYPNKFIYNLLNSCISQLDFLKREYCPAWGKFKFKNKSSYCRYDVYFSINGQKYIVEMDGGLGHGNKAMDKNLSIQDTLSIDSIKDKLAFEHQIIVIRIDCDYKENNRFNYIKEQIAQSELCNLLDFSSIDFDYINKQSQSSLVVEVCKLWENGYSCAEICKTLNIASTVANRYLNQGKEIGMCQTYSVKASRNRSFSNKVFCITTNKLFDSIIDAANYYNLDPGCISKCCRHKATHGGELPNRTQLIWIYYNDYKNMSKEQVKTYIPMSNGNYTKIICLNTMEIFNQMKLAAIWCNLKTTSSIVACCKGKYKSAGTHPDTGESLKWKYYTDYLKENS